MRRKRQLRQVLGQDCVWDVVVIGGGITGSGIARDAALRGLSCLLIEKNDFASGTSSKSGKLIHGGLRYLRYLHLGLVYESCRERIRLLRTIAPHLVRPVRFYYPFYKKSHTPRWLTAIGLFVYDLLSLFRNVERFRFVSKIEMSKLEPSLLTDGLIGALSYSDCACLDSRLVIETLKSAQEAGGKVLNYCRLESITFRDKIEAAISTEKNTNVSRISLQVRDTLDGDDFCVHAKTVMNASGAWADDVLDRRSLNGSSSVAEDTGAREKFHLKLTCGIHLVFRQSDLPVTHTLTIEAVQDHRNVYLVPWGEHVLVGTTDTVFKGDKEHVPVYAEHVQYLLETLRSYFPSLNINNEHIQNVFSGVRPLIGSSSNQKEEKIPRDFEISVDSRGIISITGGKLTTYRAMAERAVDALIQNFFRDIKLKQVSTVNPISGGMIEKRETCQEECASVNMSHMFEALWERYGDNTTRIVEIIKTDHQKGKYIGCTHSIWAEIDYMVEHEFVERLGDILFRRSAMFLFSNDKGFEASSLIAPYMAKLLEWDQARTDSEILKFRNEVEFSFQYLKQHKEI